MGTARRGVYAPTSREALRPRLGRAAKTGEVFFRKPPTNTALPLPHAGEGRVRGLIRCSVFHPVQNKCFTETTHIHENVLDGSVIVSKKTVEPGFRTTTNPSRDSSPTGRASVEALEPSPQTPNNFLARPLVSLPNPLWETFECVRVNDGQGDG